MLDEGSLYGDLLGAPTVAPKPDGGASEQNEADGDSPYGNLLEPMTPKAKEDDMFSMPAGAAGSAAPQARPAQTARPRPEAAASSTPSALPQSFSAAKLMMPQKLMMPPVRKKAEAPAGKKPALTALDIQRIQEEKEALMQKTAAAKADKAAAAKAPLPAEEKKENVAVPATSSTAGVGTAISPSAPSTQNASPSLYASLYGSPDEEYDPAKPNDYDEFCRRRLRLKAEEEMERRRQETLARQQATAKPPEPKEDDPATKMMKKMGWKEGQGLGKDGQGMATPLVMKKTDRAAGVVVEGQKREAPAAQAAGQPQAKQQKTTAPSGPPTRVVLLNNLVGAGEVDEDLEEETAEEAGKYGKLKKCSIKELTGVPDDQAVRIFLEFETIQDATKALVDMNGRYFGGRVVRARFFDEARFASGDLAKGPDE